MQFGNPLSLAGQTIAYGPASLGVSGGIVNFTIPSIPAGTRTLILEIVPFDASLEGGITSMSVIGKQSGFFYYGNGLGLGGGGIGGGQVPYLVFPTGTGGAWAGFLVVIPIMSTVDNSFQVTVATPSGTCTLTAWADPQEYDEDLFYNGSHQVANFNVNTVTNTTILQGPARLLWASAAVNSGGNCILLINGRSALNPQSPAGAPGVTQSISFPGKGQLLQPGQSVVAENLINGIFSLMSIGWAYP
jgi:hypothetical protein